MMAYPVLMEDKVHQEIHIPEYLLVVHCKDPKLAENTPSSSKNH